MNFDKFYTSVKKAIDVEIKHQYIDFIGKTTCFSDFILQSLNDFRKKLSKIDKQRLEPISTCFYQYRFDSLSGRMTSVKLLEKELDYFKNAQNKALEAAKIKLEERKARKAEEEAAKIPENCRAY